MEWKKEYERCLLSNPVKLDDAINIKKKHIPSRLYKYREFDTEKHWVDWVKGKIFTNAPLNFNDPFDCLLSYSRNTYNNFLKDVCFKVLKSKKIKFNKVDKSRFELADDPGL